MAPAYAPSLMLDRYQVKMVRAGEDLLRHAPAILGLFRLCFGRPLEEAFWRWAYLDNPCGDPFVALAFYQGELVGHYAIIPQRYVNTDGPALFALSMTTMVHPAHRQAGLFRDLANLTYQEAARQGARGVVGFPNKSSTPGFKKRLGWTMREDLCLERFDVARWDGGRDREQGLTPLAPEEFAARFCAEGQDYVLNLSDPALLLWRVRKPGQAYWPACHASGLYLLKPYRGGLDVVFSPVMEENSFGAVARFARERGCAFLCALSGPGRWAPRPPGERTPYVFGYRWFGEDAPSFRVDLVNSDVF